MAASNRKSTAMSRSLMSSPKKRWVDLYQDEMDFLDSDPVTEQDQVVITKGVNALTFSEAVQGLREKMDQRVKEREAGLGVSNQSLGKSDYMDQSIFKVNNPRVKRDIERKRVLALGKLQRNRLRRERALIKKYCLCTSHGKQCCSLHVGKAELDRIMSDDNDIIIID